MRRKPPGWLERVISFLIPPACREHVTGDLHERYESPGQYLRDVLTTVPAVIVSQIRRSTPPLLACMYAVAACVCLAGSAAVSFGNAAFDSPRLLTIGVTVLITVGSFVLARPWTTHLDPVRAAVSEAAFAGVVCLLIQGLFASWHISIALSSAMYPGLAATLLLLVFARNEFAQGQSFGSALLHISFPKKVQREEFRGRVRRENFRLAIAALMLAGFGLAPAFSQALPERLAGLWILGVGLILVFQVYRRSRRMEGSYRDQLLLRRNDLLRIWRWYAGPFFLGLVAFAIRLPLAHPGQPYVWVNILPFLGIAGLWSILMIRMSKRAAKQLQSEIDNIGE